MTGVVSARKTLTRSRQARIFILALADALLCAASFGAAYQLRYMPASPPDSALKEFLAFLPLLIALRLVAMHFLGQYRLSWRYVGVPDLLKTLAATTISTLAFAAITQWLDPRMSRGVLLTDWFVVTLLMGGSRLSLRMLSTAKARLPLARTSRRRALILGANDVGESVARELARRTEPRYEVVGFLDDKPEFQGQTIHGRPVLGALEKLARVVSSLRVQEVIIALPEASGAEIRRIIRQCEKLPSELRIVQDPLSDGKEAAKAQVRSIRVEDLLRRPPLNIDHEQAARYLEGQVVLITGAGGSIGAELVRQLSKLRPRLILLLGHGENSIFQIHQELCEDHALVQAVPLIGDVADKRRMEQIFRRYSPNVVFHAAAHKHVPMMETNATEAVKNNILGTRNLLEVSQQHGVETFLLISSDKAVNPSSVMGASKRVAELMVQAQGSRVRGRYVVVRFGNVLGSRGSVVPSIQRQILRGLPVTITDPAMVRFFMTIPEAVALVLQAGAIGKDGEVFVLEMGEPVRIVELARDIVRLCGLVPDRDVKFRYTGIRPGEKLHEELLTAGESTVATRHDRIFRVRPDFVDEPLLHRQVDVLAAAAWNGDEETVLERLQDLVPTFRSGVQPPHDEVHRARSEQPTMAVAR